MLIACADPDETRLCSIQPPDVESWIVYNIAGGIQNPLRWSPFFSVVPIINKHPPGNLSNANKYLK
jgi:hypothetical protein